jgi:hypothetical protein
MLCSAILALKASSIAGLGAEVAQVLGLEANTWIASAFIVNAYSIDLVAIPPEVGTCAPIFGSDLTLVISGAYLRVC